MAQIFIKCTAPLNGKPVNVDCLFDESCVHCFIGVLGEHAFKGFDEFFKRVISINPIAPFILIPSLSPPLHEVATVCLQFLDTKALKKINS